MPREGSKLRESVGRIGSGKVSKKKKKFDRKTYGLTNRPEFQSKNLKCVEFKQREKHQNLPNDAGRLVIRNLDFKIKSIDLEDIFATFGKIIRIDILQRNRRSIGTAYVDFEKEFQAEKALEYNQMPLDGREMRIDLIRGSDIYHDLRHRINEIKGYEDRDRPISSSESDDSEPNREKPRLKSRISRPKRSSKYRRKYER